MNVDDGGLPSLDELIHSLASASEEAAGLVNRAYQVRETLRSALIVQIRQICKLSKVVQENDSLHNASMRARLQSSFAVMSSLKSELRISKEDHDSNISIGALSEASELENKIQKILREIMEQRSQLAYHIKRFDPCVVPLEPLSPADSM